MNMPAASSPESLGPLPAAAPPAVPADPGTVPGAARKRRRHHKTAGVPGLPPGPPAARPTDGQSIPAKQMHWASAGLGTFTAVGFLRSLPEIAENRVGCAAYFSVQLSQDRELDLRMVGGSRAEIERRLKGIDAGMAITVVGHIVGPRIGLREAPAHFADRIIPHPGHSIA